VESTSELPKMGHAIDRELAIGLMGWTLMADDATCGTWFDGSGYYVLVPSEKHFEIMGEVVGPNSFSPSRSWVSIPKLWKRLASLGYYVIIEETMKSESEDWTCKIEDRTRIHEHAQPLRDSTCNQISVNGVNPLEVFCRAALKAHKELTPIVSLEVD